MKDSLKNKCRLFIENRDVFKAAFPWENSNFYPICASSFVNHDKLADAEHLKNIRSMLKNRVNAFSNFRSACELPIVATLALDERCEDRLESAIELHACLKEHFFGSEFLPVAAVALSGEVKRERYGEISERARRIYDLMKKSHPFLTSGEDCVFAAMLALSDKTDSELMRDVEISYNTLKDKFHDRNALQSLSHVLTLVSEEMLTAQDKCNMTVRLFDELKEKNQKYGTGYELATLGAIATLPCGTDETVRDLIDVSEFLKTQKGYGFWGIGKTQRLMHAAMIVTSEHVGCFDAMSGAAIGGTVSMIAAQQAATCAAISVSIAAANAAHR